MASKKKKDKKSKTKKDDKKQSNETDELRAMIESLKQEIETMKATIETQDKRIKSLEDDQKRTAKYMRTLNMTSTSSSTDSMGKPDSSSTKTEDDSKQDIDTESKEESEPSSPDNQVSQPAADNIDDTDNIVVKAVGKPIRMKFMFDLAHPGKIKTIDNGSAVMKPQSTAGTIRFGKLLHFKDNNSRNVGLYRITFDTRAIGQSSTLALGFATKGFNTWNGSNFGDNCCCFVKGSGQFVTSQGLFKTVDGKEYQHKQVIKELLIEPRQPFFKEGEDVTVEVDLQHFRGRIWNESSNENGGDEGRVFVIGLPEKKDVSIIAYLGGAKKKKLEVKEQEFYGPVEE